MNRKRSLALAPKLCDARKAATGAAGQPQELEEQGLQKSRDAVSAEAVIEIKLN